jgi:hypothetical protein
VNNDPTTPVGVVEDPPLADLDDLQPDESLLAEVHRRRIVSPATRVLLALIVVAGAFLAGALVDRWQRPASSSSSAQSLLAQFRRGRGGASGASGATGASGAGGSGLAALFGGGGGGGATVGTVELVDGRNVYVQDAQGNVIKVTTTPATQVTISKTGTVGQLAPGSTVIVQGTMNSDGTQEAATSISPSSGFGRFGGGGGRGAGAGG